jgi:acetyl esterase/lipase
MKTMSLNLTHKNVTLTAYLLDRSPEMLNTWVRPAVLVLPGGGYYSCSDREAEPIALAFLAEGYQAFVLRYSLGENAAFPRPLNDAEEALALIRAKAEEWAVDPGKIAVCGFSAGGHLAAALGTMGRVRPNALILAYPCILDSISKILAAPVPSLEQQVDRQTPPTFLFATAADQLVPVEHSLQFAVALDRARVPFEMHIFQNGTHGLSLAKPVTSSGMRMMVDDDAAKWMGLSIAWLENLFGAFPSDREVTTAIAAPKATEYSIDIVMEVCWANPACQDLILEYFPAMSDHPQLNLALSASIRQINGYLPEPLSQETLAELDYRLKAIPFNINGEST